MESIHLDDYILDIYGEDNFNRRRNYLIRYITWYKALGELTQVVKGEGIYILDVKKFQKVLKEMIQAKTINSKLLCIT